MSLVQAIDALLAFVDDKPIPQEGNRRDQFEALDRDVYVHACRAGLKNELPEPHPDGKHLGKTSLPGSWTIDPAAFHPIGLRAWRNDLLALRTLAETLRSPTKQSTGRGAAPEAPVAPPGQVTASNVLRLSGGICHIAYTEGAESGDFTNREDSYYWHLARLLAEPNRRFRAMGLRSPDGAGELQYLGRDESSDSEALDSFEARLQELVRELKEAEAAQDQETAEQLRKEFQALTKHLDGEKGPTKRGRKKKCGTPSPAEKADQALRVGLGRLYERLRKNGLPKLAAHLERCIGNAGGEWWYAPPPGTTTWQVTWPEPGPKDYADR